LAREIFGLKPGFQSRVKVEVPAVSSFVLLCTFWRGSSNHVKNWSEFPGVVVAAENTRADPADHGGAHSGAFRGVGILSLEKGPLENVGKHLTPERAPKTVPGSNKLRQTGSALLHGFNDLAQRESDPFQKGPSQMCRTMP
jgi:hypothetical protein